MLDIAKHCCILVFSSKRLTKTKGHKMKLLDKIMAAIAIAGVAYVFLTMIFLMIAYQMRFAGL